MSYEKPTEVWQPQDIADLVRLIDVMEQPDFKVCEWQQTASDDPKVIHLPYPSYHPAIDQLWDLLYHTSAYIDPYAPLPEDPTNEGIPFSVMGTTFPLDYFKTATLNQVRRYLVLCTRGERFCDGHMAGEFESGKMLAALHRLSVLQSRLQLDPSADG